MYNELSLYGPWWLIVLAVPALPLVLYYLHRRRVPLWLLIPLAIVIAPVVVLAAIIGLMPLLAFLLPLYTELSGQAWGGVTIGYRYNSQPNPLQVYMLEGAAALLVVALIVYLIRRR